jgi:ATP-binding cassette, subfamily C (CFTR/MRP), member 1
MISLIYPKMLRLPTANLSESSAVALMGNDVETLVTQLNKLLIEWWASALTVGIAIWLLAMQLGAVCVVPIIAACRKLLYHFLGSRDVLLMSPVALVSSSMVGKATIKRLTTYQMAAQNRINFTSQVISSIKTVKMLGFVEPFTRMVREKRREDISGGRRFRWLLVLDNAISEKMYSQDYESCSQTNCGVCEQPTWL